MLRRLLLLTLAAAFMAACSLPGGVPQQAATATSAPAGESPAPTATPSTAGADPTATPTPSGEDETQAPPQMVEPPPATLTINGQSQTSGIGTYCWNSADPSGGPGLCVDKLGVPTPRDPLQVDAVPFTAQFAFAADLAPTGVSLTVIPVTPESEMAVDGTPDWRWWPFGAGQTHELPAATTTEVALSPAPGLYALTVFTFFEGRGDVVYGFLVQVGAAPETPTGGGAFTLPAACQPGEGQSPYVDPGGRYCLLYPSYFRIADVTLDRAGFIGPALDDSIEPVFAALSVSVNGATGGRSLTQVVDEYVTANAQGLPVTRSALTLSGEPAELVEGLPGRTMTWQVFTVHNDTIFQLVLFPKDEAYPQAAPDLDAVWNAVSGSFTFLR